MSQVFTSFREAAAMARRLAESRGEPVDVRRLSGGWDVPSYCRWAGELREDLGYLDMYASDERPIATGLAPPDWEVLSNDPRADTWDWDGGAELEA